MRDEASSPYGLGEDRPDGGCARPRAYSILALLWQESGAHTFLPPPRIREGDTGIGEGTNKDIHPDTKERTMGTAPFGRTNLFKATLLVVTGVLAACLVALVGAAGPVGAAFPGENGKIAFTSERDGNDEIYVMNADGSGVERLTNNPAVDGFPAFSADGTKIAFSSYRNGGNQDIFVMNANGSGPVNLTNNPALDQHPAFSPDGTRIAFMSDRDGNWETYAMNADGTGQTNLTNYPGYDYAPDWQPLATRYDFAGFYAPVDNQPTFNKAKAGSAIPVKFSLGGDQGLDVFAKNAAGTATTSPTSGPVACDSTAEIDPIETTVSASASGLSYDAASDTYTYVWKTHKGWTGCRQLVVEFDDGTVERANFKFVK